MDSGTTIVERFDGNGSASYEQGMQAYIRKDYAEAHRLLAQAAQKGHAGAMQMLGVLCQKGLGCREDQAQGFAWTKRAAEVGVAAAQYNLGRCYEMGKGTRPDLAQARIWYQRAADQGDALAKAALEQLGPEKAAEPPAAPTPAELTQQGDDYYYGRNQREKNYAKAAELYRAAADKGYARAMYCLGYCYEFGQGVTQSSRKALKWYRAAAKQKDADAMYRLGIYYERKSKEYDPLQLARDHSQAWFKRARHQYKIDAKDGSASAQRGLGNCYYYGRGVEMDDSKAVEWYRAAAKQGDSYAMNKLGDCYKNGWGVKKDNSEAVEWYRAAAEQGDKTALANLKKCYYSWSSKSALSDSERRAMQDAKEALQALGALEG